MDKQSSGGFDLYSEFEIIHALHGKRDRWIQREGVLRMPEIAAG